MALRPDAVWFNIGLTMFGDRCQSLGGFLLPAGVRALGARSVVTLHEFPNDQIAGLGIDRIRMRRLGLHAINLLVHQADSVCLTINGGRNDRDGRALSQRPRRTLLPLCGYAVPSIEPFETTQSILMLTSHAPYKNVPLLLEAFQKVRSHVPQATLVIAGIDHPRFPGYLEDLRGRYRDQAGVTWRGPVATVGMRQLFCQARVVVAPYQLATGSSATVHQAIGLGRPVVLSDLPEFRSMAVEEDLCLSFFPRGDAERLADALRLLLIDPARCRAIAQHNHRSALRNSLETTTEAYVRLLGGSPASPRLTPSLPSSSGTHSPSIFHSS